jgi:hypothetical protein
MAIGPNEFAKLTEEELHNTDLIEKRIDAHLLTEDPFKLEIYWPTKGQVVPRVGAEIIRRYLNVGWKEVIFDTLSGLYFVFKR